MDKTLFTLNVTEAPVTLSSGFNFLITNTNEVWTSNSTNISCQDYEKIQHWFEFDTYQLIRVLITWLFFLLGATGNIFVMFSLRIKSRLHHLIMFHLAMADLAYTCFVLPLDAVWNTTMQWVAGEAMCKLCQMLKQFGMYSSSFMVVVIGVDRVTAILTPLSASHQKRIGIILVSVAWISSAMCCIPAGLVFSIKVVPTCQGFVLEQCVDNLLISREQLNSYYFFTMFASFILPFFSTIVSYSLIVCEISKMKERDRALMGRRNSVNSNSIQRAINKTVLMRTLITLTFLLCWGPYYAKGIVDWFIKDENSPSTAAGKISYMVMYLNSILHPIVFGIFLKEVREKFHTCCHCFFKKKKAVEKCRRCISSRTSFTSLATNTTQYAHSSLNNNTTSSLLGSKPVIKKKMSRTDSWNNQMSSGARTDDLL